MYSLPLLFFCILQTVLTCRGANFPVLGPGQPFPGLSMHQWKRKNNKSQMIKWHMAWLVLWASAHVDEWPLACTHVPGPRRKEQRKPVHEDSSGQPRSFSPTSVTEKWVSRRDQYKMKGVGNHLNSTLRLRLGRARFDGPSIWSFGLKTGNSKWDKIQDFIAWIWNPAKTDGKMSNCFRSHVPFFLSRFRPLLFLSQGFENDREVFGHGSRTGRDFPIPFSGLGAPIFSKLLM
jgi:hypothetical protein